MAIQQILDDKFKSPLSLIKGMLALPGSMSSSLDLILATVLINILSLAVPLTLMQTYDRIIPYKAVGSMIWLMGGCLIAIVFELSVRIFRGFVSNWMAARFEHQLSCSAVDKLLCSTLQEYERHSVGTHMDRMNAIYILRRFYAGQLFQVILDLPFSLLFLFAIWFLGKWLVLIPIITTLILFLVTFVSRIGFERASERLVSANEERFDFIFKLLSRIHKVKTLTLEEQMLRQHEKYQEATAEASMELADFSMLPQNVGAFFSQLTLFSVIIAGAVFVIDGSLTLGIVTASSMMSTRAIQPLQNAISFWLRFTEAKIAKSRLQEIADMEPERTFTTERLPGKLEGGVSFFETSYQDPQTGQTLLDKVSFTINPGEMISVSAESEEHISRFLLLITGRLRADEGNVYVDDYNIHEWDFADLRGKIEYVPKKGTIFKGSILENITLFEAVRGHAATNIAHLLDIDEEVSRLPEGYRTIVDNQSSFLSSGLIQRIALARALVIRPMILLIDNSDNLMDQSSRETLYLLLKRLKGKSTIFVASESRVLTEMSDRSITIKDGQVSITEN